MLQDLKGKVTGRGEITEVNMVTNFFLTTIIIEKILPKNTEIITKFLNKRHL